MKISRSQQNGGSRNIRFALVVFIGLVIFCVAQLTWWIIFQLDLSRQLYDYRVELLRYRVEAASSRVNSDFRRLGALAEQMFSQSLADASHFESCAGTLIADPAVVGVSGLDSGASVYGKADSTFYYPSNSGITVYFNPAYPRDILAVDDDDIVFDQGPGHHSGTEGRWVKSTMFSIAPGLLTRLKDDAHAKTRMFISEGSFFILIMLAGAFLIYRTLRKSEELNLRQAGFIQSVTHEFRTPLTSLRLYVETLQSGAIKRDEAKKLYGKMLDDCQRLDSMIDNVLEAGHVGRGDRQVKLSESDLRQDLTEYLDGLRPYIERQDGTLTTDIIDRPLSARTDYHALGRAVRALVENAVRYAPPERREVTVRLTESNGRAVISVIDQGPGIPPEERKRIFDRFYRINDERSRRIKGTGLGLHLAQHIVEAHGGKISVESPGENRGSTFTIELPLA